MIYDSFTLAACITELRRATPGMIVHQVRQPDDLTIVLVCRFGPQHAEITLSAHPQFARAHLSTVRDRAPKTPPGFCQLLRKHIEGSKVEEFAQEGLDRILILTFRTADGERKTLIHEMMGRHSNIVLVSPDRKILGAIKYIPARLSRVRQILPGRDYLLPPASKLDPREVSEEQFASIWADAFIEQAAEADVRKWLVSKFTGVSPTLAAEITSRAEDIHPASVFDAFRLLLDIFSTQRFAPVVIHYPGKKMEEVYPIPLLSLPHEYQHSRATISEAFEIAVRAEIIGGALESTREEVLRLITKSRDRQLDDIADLLDIIDKPDKGEVYRRKGDILAANFGVIEAGSDTIELPDYYDPEMKPTSIALHPDITASENIQRYYKLARKAEERYYSAEERLPGLKKDVERLDAAEDEIKAAQSLEEVRERRQALLNARLIAQPQAVQAKDAQDRPFGGFRIRTHTSVDGIEILVGESAEANDYLTTKLAKADDVWLHARAVTGAHVLIRAAGIRELPPRTLQEAASLAASNSDAKHSSYIPVDWTRKKHVRKPRRAPAGTVTYSHEKTIHITK